MLFLLSSSSSRISLFCLRRLLYNCFVLFVLLFVIGVCRVCILSSTALLQLPCSSLLLYLFLCLCLCLSVFYFLVGGKALELGEMGHWCNSARGRGVRAWCGAGMAVVCLQRPTVTASSSPSSHRQGYGSLPSFHGACRVLQVNEFNPLNFSRGSVVGWWACRVGIRDSWQEKQLPPLMWGDLELEAQVNRHIVGISLP